MDEETEDELETSFHKMRFQEFERRGSSPAGAARPWDLGIQTAPMQPKFVQPTFMQPLVDAAIIELKRDHERAIEK